MENNLENIGKISDGHAVKWNIANFVQISKRNGTAVSITSPSFDLLAATWNLILLPFNSYEYGRYNLSYNYANISLKRKCSNIKDHAFDYKVELEASGRILRSFTGSLCFQGNDKDVTKIISSDNIALRDATLTSTSTVTVLLNIFPQDSTIQSAVYHIDSINFNREGVEQLSSDIQKLHGEGQDSDLKIRVQTKEFSVHRAILAARSPVLYSMLHHDMVEKNTGIVDIVDFEADIFNDFLLYLYSGRVDGLTWENVTKLFALSDKYDLQHLNKTCRAYMLHKICVEQFCDVLELAVKYEEKDLLKCSEEFFVKNVKSIIITKQWKEFMDKNSTVCNELFIKLVSNLPSGQNN